MATTRAISWGLTGVTVYATLRDPATGEMWVEADGLLAALSPAVWADYARSCSETPAASYLYLFTTPPTLPPGWYELEAYQQNDPTGDPAITDKPWIYREIVWWSGDDLLSESEYAATLLTAALAGSGEDGVSPPSPGAI